jgi:hypothetical protein
MSFLKNELNPRDPSKMTVSHAKWISQVVKYHRIWNVNGFSNWNAKWNCSQSRQTMIFDSMNSMEASPIVFMFSPLPNVLTLTLNATETVNIILELRFKSGVNLVRLHAFFVEKADHDSLVIFHRWLQNLHIYQFQKDYLPLLFRSERWHLIWLAEYWGRVWVFVTGYTGSANAFYIRLVLLLMDPL